MLHMHGLIFCQCDFSNSVVFFENVIFQISSFFVILQRYSFSFLF